jgi:hypothetical protein
MPGGVWHARGGGEFGWAVAPPTLRSCLACQSLPPSPRPCLPVFAPRQAESDMEAVQFEKKQLLAHWKSSLASVQRRARNSGGHVAATSEL